MSSTQEVGGLDSAQLLRIGERLAKLKAAARLHGLTVTVGVHDVPRSIFDRLPGAEESNGRVWWKHPRGESVAYFTCEPPRGV